MDALAIDMPVSAACASANDGQGQDFWKRHPPKTLLNVNPPLWGYDQRQIGNVTAWGWIPWPRRSTRALYEMDLDAVHPITLLCAAGLMVQPNRHMVSDGLSIPPTVEWLTGIEHDRSSILQYWHDSGYRDGGFFVRYAWQDDFTFTAMTRDEVDQIVQIVGPLDPVADFSSKEICTIYDGLHLFGVIAWRGYRSKDKQTGGVGHRNDTREGG